MARSINRLTARSVSAISKKGRYADGGGLYLQIGASGAKSWLFRYMLSGRARQMGLGSVHTVSLAEARQEALACRKLLRDGVDPIAARQAERARMLAETVSAMTFRECAEAYMRSHEAGWRNAKHGRQWRSTLETYAYPIVGGLPVDLVTTEIVLKVLEPIWRTKTETASRVRGRMESILDWATVRKYRAGENPARWKGHLDKLLPAKSKIQSIKHHAALPYQEVAAFMAVLKEQDGIAADALAFQILTAARTSEVLGARWAEIDFEQAIWTVPADRMKTGKEHRVPLSSAALEIVERARETLHSDYVFPGRKRGPLSNMAFLQLLKRMRRNDLTVHGFRSTFRDWAAESTNFPAEVAEMALAHAVGDKVEAAYRRGDLFEKRRALMLAWAVYCDVASHDSTTGNVVLIGHRRT